MFLVIFVFLRFHIFKSMQLVVTLILFQVYAILRLHCAAKVMLCHIRF